MSKVQRWTGLVTAADNGGFVAAGDYLALEREVEMLRAALAAATSAARQACVAAGNELLPENAQASDSYTQAVRDYQDAIYAMSAITTDQTMHGFPTFIDPRVLLGDAQFKIDGRIVGLIKNLGLSED